MQLKNTINEIQFWLLLWDLIKVNVMDGSLLKGVLVLEMLLWTTVFQK